MLDIINNLKPFFEDCYRRINVREYARLMKISAPTASKILFELNNEKILEVERDRNYIFFYANKNSKVFLNLSKIYWEFRLNDLIDYLEKSLVDPTLVLFGSLTKVENKNDSDIDLVIFSSKKDLTLESFEKKLKRKIQVFWYNSFEKIKNKDLANNILNGYVLTGKIKL